MGLIHSHPGHGLDTPAPWALVSPHSQHTPDYERKAYDHPFGAQLWGVLSKALNFIRRFSTFETSNPKKKSNIVTLRPGILALAGVTHWIERQLANRKVASSIPSLGTCLGCGTGPQ